MNKNSNVRNEIISFLSDYIPEDRLKKAYKYFPEGTVKQSLKKVAKQYPVTASQTSASENFTQVESKGQEPEVRRPVNRRKTRFIWEVDLPVSLKDMFVNYQFEIPKKHKDFVICIEFFSAGEVIAVENLPFSTSLNKSYIYCSHSGPGQAVNTATFDVPTGVDQIKISLHDWESPSSIEGLEHIGVCGHTIGNISRNVTIRKNVN